MCGGCDNDDGSDGYGNDGDGNVNDGGIVLMVVIVVVVIVLMIMSTNDGTDVMVIGIAGMQVTY